ncbi:MAG: flagellar motor switch protein FliM [Clostridiales bacterium]|nr:flagellar motor switch protein FliM [Clostridiales bacterium]
MKNVLSQDEIDSLINALSTGQLDTESVEIEASRPHAKVYDFRRPNKLTKDQMQTLRGIHENYARIVSNILSNQVRNNVKLTIASIEQVTFGEYIRSIPNPTIMGMFTAEPLDGISILELNPAFCFNMIDLYFGGAMTHRFNVREFTDIEMIMTKEILKSMIENLRSVWSDVIEMAPVLEAVETNPLLQQALPHNETVVLMTFKVQILEENTFINLCIPYRTIERVSDELHAKNYDIMKSRKTLNEYREDIEAVLNRVKVDMRVLLGKTHITVNDFVELDVGDILELDTRLSQPMKLFVENKPKFYVQPGLYNNRLSVQVVSDIGKEAEEDE